MKVRVLLYFAHANKVRRLIIIHIKEYIHGAIMKEVYRGPKNNRLVEWRNWALASGGVRLIEVADVIIY